MRIIGGSRAGRTIDAPSGHSTRPTSDRVREALFNRIVHAALPGVCAEGPLSGPVLDLFAGSGALGLEALSRGAPRCDFVDVAPAACATVERNIATLELGGVARVHKQRVEPFLRRATPGYTLLFADPPYADGALLDDVLAIVHERALLVDGALVVLEHAPSPAPKREQPGLVFVDERAYGQTVVSWFTAARRDTGGDA
jgi:16S rRNA (guanine966-N2)-methyltransferase